MFYDFLAACVAWNVFFYFRKYLLSEEIVGFQIKSLTNSLLVGVFWVLLYALAGCYQDIYRKSRVKELLQVLWVSVPGVVVIFFTLLINDEGVGKYTDLYKTFFAYSGIHIFLLLFEKAVVLSYIKKLIRTGKLKFNTLIVGSNVKAKEIIKELEKINSQLGLSFIGYVHVFDKTKNLLSDELRHFGDYRNISRLIKLCNVEQVIIAIEPSEHERIANILNMIDDDRVKIGIVSDLYNILTGRVRVNHLLGIPLVEVKQHVLPPWQKVLKRVFDISFSLLFFLLAGPFLIVIAILTKMSSKGPIFFYQERIGRHEKPFKIIKFRSMYTDAEKMGPALSSDDDPRITPWGKVMRQTRLDELPQFFNVLKGDMSIVGPRPERQFFIDQIVQHAPHYRYLLRVRPGITSLGQVKYGYAENVDEMVRRLKFDVIYLENMSLAMDFRIFIYTIKTVLYREGK